MDGNHGFNTLSLPPTFEELAPDGADVITYTTIENEVFEKIRQSTKDALNRILKWYINA